jgi:predicted nucleotidyltransferase
MRKAASGRFVLRLPQGIHEALRTEASRRGRSLNSICQEALESYVTSGSGKADDSSMISDIRQLLGDSLKGIVLFGSVARGEARQGSDVDLLIALDQDRVLSRSLYSAWDEQVRSGARSPHFVHVPVKAADAGSVWMEASVDGVVLYDRDGGVSRFLGSLRGLIASGGLKRRWAHGHPYWVWTKGEKQNVQ